MNEGEEAGQDCGAKGRERKQLIGTVIFCWLVIGYFKKRGGGNLH